MSHGGGGSEPGVPFVMCRYEEKGIVLQRRTHLDYEDFNQFKDDSTTLPLWNMSRTATPLGKNAAVLSAQSAINVAFTSWNCIDYDYAAKVNNFAAILCLCLCTNFTKKKKKKLINIRSLLWVSPINGLGSTDYSKLLFKRKP